MKKIIKKVVFTSIFLATASVGLTQNNEVVKKWEVEHIGGSRDVFGDRNNDGTCQMWQNLLYISYDYTSLSITGIIISKNENGGLQIILKAFREISQTSQSATLSFKTENNKIVAVRNGYYDAEKMKATFTISNEILSLFKNSSKLKAALVLSTEEPIALQINCVGFTKAYNEMLKCN